MIEQVRQDLRFGLRSLRLGRSVTLVAIASLAIGIAANATVFSLVQAVEFPRLLYPDAGRLIFLESRNDLRGLTGMPVSAPDALDIAAGSPSLGLGSLAADQTSILREGTLPRRVSGRRVTPPFFDVMGVPASLGRTLTSQDRQDAIVLSDDLWRTAFLANPAIVGRPIHIDGGVVTVVGVMPARFDADAGFWVPLPPGAGFARDDRQFTLFARLAPQASVDTATRELADISRRLAGDHPATNRDWTTYPVPLARLHGRASRGTFFLLQGAVAIVLLIACANIANILLARGTRRRHEMAVRVALGASRGRLLGGLLAESLLLSLAGGAAGVLLSMWGIQLARISGGFPDVLEPTLNVLVLAFTAAVSMLTGVLSGILPALRASRVQPETVLRAEDGRGGSGTGRGTLRAALVAVQIACALVLAICGTLMLRTLANRERVALGFDPRGAIRADVSPAGERYRDVAAVRAAVDRILGEVRVEPDIVAAGAATWALPTAPGGQRTFTLPDGQLTALGGSIDAVTPSYLEALGAPLRAGRLFTESDREGSAPVAIVNEELARRLWPDRNPLGERLRLGTPAHAAPIVDVVGVVATIRRSAMHDTPVARAYLPFAQHPNATVSIVVRGRGDAASSARALQRAVARTDAALLVEGLRTMEADVAQFVAPVRLMTSLLTGFGVMGLLLAGLGIFGTMSYVVSQREREMAVRLALGADRRDIAGLVFRNALRITVVGMIAGAVAAVAATRLLGSFLFGVSPTDPLTFVAVAGFLAVVSLAACYRPARIASATDPMTILRQ